MKRALGILGWVARITAALALGVMIVVFLLPAWALNRLAGGSGE